MYLVTLIRKGTEVTVLMLALNARIVADCKVLTEIRSNYY